MSNTSNPIKTIYDKREEFIIIGLTGRTGAGCTTISQILETSDITFPEPSVTNFSTYEDRKYQIIYNYIQNGHWHSFKRISLTDIILSFTILKINEIKELISETFNQDNMLVNNIINKFKNQKDILSDYDTIFKKFNKCLNTSTLRLKRDKESFILEVDLLESISKLHEKIKNILNSFTYCYKDEITKNDTTANVYTFFLQKIGNNIRSSGKANDKNFNGKSMFSIAQRTNDFIKAIRFKNSLNTQRRTFICLDAIRNPYEATYFQDRYSNFYLFAVNTDNEERVRRLTYLNLSKDQIDNIDNIEYGKHSSQEKFSNQDISACC